MKAQFALQPHQGGGPVVAVVGEIDSSNSDDFERVVREYRPGALVVVDLGSLEYCDSAGFAALDRLGAEAVASIVIGPGCPIRKAAALLNLPFHDTVDDALPAGGSGLV